MPNKIKEGTLCSWCPEKTKEREARLFTSTSKSGAYSSKASTWSNATWVVRSGVMQTGIVEGEASIHISNVVLVDADTGEIGRVRWRELEDGTRVRTVRGGRNG